MRIAQMIDLLQIGGAQKLQVTLATALQGRPVDLTVISLSADTSSPIPDELRALGVRVVHFPAGRLLDAGRFRRVVEFLRQERFEIVQSHLAYANIMGSFAGRLSGIPAICTLHSAGVDPDRPYTARQKVETIAMRYAARRVVAVGHVVAAFHQPRLPHKRIDVILNAVTPVPLLSAAERRHIRTEMIGDADRPLIIAVGRLVPPKGYSDLVSAFAELRQTHPQAALAIVGEGRLRADLEPQIAALGLNNHAFLLGARNDVPSLLAASDLCASSSHWEGLPVAVLEAMAAGLPVVATSVGDVAHVVVPGTGVVVPPKAPHALAAALRSLLDNPAEMEQMGTAARTHVTRQFSPSAWADQWVALYDEVRARPGGVLQPRKDAR